MVALSRLTHCAPEAVQISVQETRLAAPRASARDTVGMSVASVIASKAIHANRGRRRKAFTGWGFGRTSATAGASVLHAGVAALARC